MFRSVLIALLAILALSASMTAQTDASKFRVYDSQGAAASVADIIKALDKADVIFLGENHDDSVAHSLQLEIFRQAIDSYSAKRPVTLSLEMFESDVQIVLNEYLNGQISEAHFLLSSRPWGNYKTDYRPLVELAKEKKLNVIAANAPRRYVNMVSRLGRESLNGLSPEGKRWLAPLPFPEPSEAYEKKFKGLMGASGEARMGLDNILASQSLWDATMAYFVAETLKKNKNALVIHLNGSFHTENRLGTVEQLLKYRPKTSAIVVTMRYEENFTTFDPAKHRDLGDFVVLTDAKEPRSKG